MVTNLIHYIFIYFLRVREIKVIVKYKIFFYYKYINTQQTL